MFTEDMSAFFQVSDFAELATHTDSSGDETVCNVIIEHEVQLIGEYSDTQVSADTMLFNKSDISNPLVGDTVTILSGINAGTWTLHRLLQNDPYTRTFEARKQ